MGFTSQSPRMKPTDRLTMLSSKANTKGLLNDGTFLAIHYALSRTDLLFEVLKEYLK